MTEFDSEFYMCPIIDQWSDYLFRDQDQRCMCMYRDIDIKNVSDWRRPVSLPCQDCCMFDQKSSSRRPEDS